MFFIFDFFCKCSFFNLQTLDFLLIFDNFRSYLTNFLLQLLNSLNKPTLIILAKSKTLLLTRQLALELLFIII